MAAVVDTDSHVYEPAVVWDEYVPAPERDRARSAFHHVIDAEGRQTTVLNGQPARPLSESRLVRQAIWRPGMTVEQIGQLDPGSFYPLNPGAWSAEARLADMDVMGIDQAVLFPTLFAEYLPQVVDAEAAAILARAYNDWLWDMCDMGRGRLHPVAVVAMNEPELAVAELQRAASRGFRSVMLRPAFYPLDTTVGSRGRTVAAATAPDAPMPPVFIEDEPFRAVWTRADELGLVVCVHPSLGVTGSDAVSSGGFAARVSSRLINFPRAAEPIAYMQDAQLFVTAALFHGLLEDLPSLRLAIIHAGVSWVPLALEKAETYLWLQPQGAAPVCLEPEDVWDRHPLIVSFDSWEKPVARLPDMLAAKAAWGSRYPHHDTATPGEARDMLSDHGVDEPTIDRLLGGNAAELFGLSSQPG